MRLKAFLVFGLILLAQAFALASPTAGELNRWQQQARNVTITRDDWGIAHVVGKTDADAVFGMIYAQAEDDFNRIETNYLNSMGRLAEAEGEAAIWSDLRQRLFIDEVELRRDYERSPMTLKTLMNAWADGLNYYLATHPETKPRVLSRFEPWMPLSFSEGSIGGDIESINLANLRSFYGGTSGAVGLLPPPSSTVMAANQTDPNDPLVEPSGSNGIAISPKNTSGGKALLLINPHTSFFFRSELQMTSGEGLNAYGAATWGQFFIYQGFNDRLGWMHTSGSVDAIDEYAETVSPRGSGHTYRFGSEQRPVISKPVKIRYKTASGSGERVFTAYRTHHGPIVSKRSDGKWLAVALMHKPVEALMQSYGRTRARNFHEFKKVMDLNANSSNNTLYADADGNTAYFHVNYVPRRDPKFNWSSPVDGSDPAADYKGEHTYNELPHLKNPASGWVYNTNNYPWSAAGPSSLKAADYPAYVDIGVENARGIHAIKVLENRKDFTLEKLQAAAYDSYLPWFERTIPGLIKAYNTLPANVPRRAELAGQIDTLRKWDYRWSVDSVATSLAVFWGEAIIRKLNVQPRTNQDQIAKTATNNQMLEALTEASARLTRDFGKWQTPWGDINRFQRITGDIVHPFDDTAPSIPVAFTSANWGSLASFAAAPRRGSKKWYGTSGNSFVAVVEFGKKVRAKAVTAGGESGDPRSKHFNDQALRYSKGDLREVYFYPDQLKGHTERVYRPGN